MSATSQEEATGMSWLTLASGVLITLIVTVSVRFRVVPNQPYHKSFAFPGFIYLQIAMTVWTALNEQEDPNERSFSSMPKSYKTRSTDCLSDLLPIPEEAALSHQEGTCLSPKDRPLSYSSFGPLRRGEVCVFTVLHQSLKLNSLCCSKQLPEERSTHDDHCADDQSKGAAPPDEPGDMGGITF